MRSLIMLAALSLGAAPLVACSSHDDDTAPGVAASGSGTTRSFAVADFTGVSLRGSDDVDVRVGTSFSVRAEGPGAELDKLRIERFGDTLRVGRKNSSGITWSGGEHDGVTVFVTMPRIVTAIVAGSGNMTVDRVEGQSFAGTSAGSGNLTITALSAPKATLSVAGSGDLAVTGSVDQLSIDLAGSGNVAAAGLKAKSADVSVAGSGEVHADVSGPARISMVGSGNVDLGKGAKCTTQKIGSGEVTCGS